MYGLVFLLTVGVLIGAETIAAAANACQSLPPGSISRTECEYQQAEKTRQEERARQRKQFENTGITAPTGTTMYGFACASGHQGTVTFLSGSPGETIEG